MRRVLIAMLFIACAAIGATRALAGGDTPIAADAPWYSGEVYAQTLVPVLSLQAYDVAVSNYSLPGGGDEAYPEPSPTPTQNGPMPPPFCSGTIPMRKKVIHFRR